MAYNGPIYRPPVESETLLLPVTEGCSHNRCRFCNMYKGVRFGLVSQDDMRIWLTQMRAYYGPGVDDAERVFLVGADPFALPAKRLIPVIDFVRENLPKVKKVTMYAAVHNVIRKSDEDLRRLANLGVDDLYMGIETALDDVLAALEKGHTLEQARVQCLRLNEAGIHHRDMLMPGAAGRGRGLEEARANAALLNETKPTMILLTTMSVFPGTPLSEDAAAGRFALAGETEVLAEERELIRLLDLPEAYLWAAHALDSTRIAGYLKYARDDMLRQLDISIANIDDEEFARTFVRASL